jgi:hypothetical protein
MQHMTMSRAQMMNLVTECIERTEDDHGLNDWLTGVAADAHSVEVGVWRCPVGEVTCAEGMCGDCGCCDNARLWESPLDWEPECRCGRKAFLVEIVGRFDSSACLA